MKAHVNLLRILFKLLNEICHRDNYNNLWSTKDSIVPGVNTVGEIPRITR